MGRQAVIVCHKDNWVVKYAPDKRYIIGRLGKYDSPKQALDAAWAWRHRWLEGRRHYATETDVLIEEEK